MCSFNFFLFRARFDGGIHFEVNKTYVDIAFYIILALSLQEWIDALQLRSIQPQHFTQLCYIFDALACKKVTGHEGYRCDHLLTGTPYTEHMLLKIAAPIWHLWCYWGGVMKVEPFDGMGLGVTARTRYVQLGAQPSFTQKMPSK